MANDTPICKYCREELKNETVLQPCLCKDYVHRKCLEEWLERKRDFSNCEICKGKYQRKHIGIDWEFIKWKFIPILLDIFLFVGFYYPNSHECEKEGINMEFVVITSIVIFLCSIVMFMMPMVFIENLDNKIESFVEYLGKYLPNNFYIIPIFFSIVQGIGITSFYLKCDKIIFCIPSFFIGLSLITSGCCLMVYSILLSTGFYWCIVTIYEEIKNLMSEIVKINPREEIKKVFQSIKSELLTAYENTIGYYFIKYDYQEIKID